MDESLFRNKRKYRRGHIRPSRRYTNSDELTACTCLNDHCYIHTLLYAPDNELWIIFCILRTHEKSKFCGVLLKKNCENRTNGT